MQWQPSNTTLASAAGQSVAAGARRRWSLIAATTVMLAAGTGLGWYFAIGKKDTTTAEVAIAPVDAQVQSTLTITAEPAVAAIRVDGVERGPSPVTIEVARGGRVNVAVARDGFEPATQVITLERDAQSVTIALRPLPIAPGDAGGVAAAPVDARPAVTTKKKDPKRKGARPDDTRKPGSAASSFDPDDAAGE